MKGRSEVDPSRYAPLLAAIILMSGITQTLGETLCKPSLTFKETRFSEIQAQQRTWTAVLAVDASRCASKFGRFDINFTRLKETAPDLVFAQPFAWHPGQVEVSVSFWADEAVLDYSVGDIAPCACADAGAGSAPGADK
jgi:hypothetical protein